MSMYNGSETYLVKIGNVIAIPGKLSPRPIISCQNFSYHTRLHHRPPHFVRRICSQIGSFQGYLGNIDRDVVFEICCHLKQTLSHGKRNVLRSVNNCTVVWECTKVFEFCILDVFRFQSLLNLICWTVIFEFYVYFISESLFLCVTKSDYVFDAF